MPDTLVGALIGGGAVMYAAMLTALVKLISSGRRRANSAAPPSCPATENIASVKQDVETFHPRLEHALERLADAEGEQTRQLVKITTLLDERLPRGGPA